MDPRSPVLVGESAPRADLLRRLVAEPSREVMQFLFDASGSICLVSARIEYVPIDTSK